LRAVSGGDVEADDACERADKQHQAGRAAQISAEEGFSALNPTVTAAKP
jgi:hypothetical protein